MAPNHQAGIALSRYRQLRVTATHETSGRFSVRLYAKPLNAAWTESHLVWQGASVSCGPILSTEDAIAAAIDILREQLLPGLG